MIIATAGHVDHGKTTLVHALTGVDTDRLAEEKRRGMSIDIGFAYVPLSGATEAGAGAGAEAGTLGFVDVPGHEKFIRNMLAGLAGIDMALLVVAADDGPMPQTREHLAILDLLGITRGAVALTKIDRVSQQRIADVTQEIQALLAPTGLCDSIIFPVAAPEGTGLATLKAYLDQAAAALQRPAASGLFRLPIDRAFSVSGAGLVVTGAVVAGQVRPGDRLLLSPAGVEVRVRGVHAQNRAADLASPGDRAALNLAGADLKRLEPGRGDWLVAAPLHAPSTLLDVRLRVHADEPRALGDGARLMLHIGATSLAARLVLLEGGSLAPGRQGLARLVLDRPIPALWGDRFVLRDGGAGRTVAGGAVLDAFGPPRGRAKPARLAELAALGHDNPGQALAALLATSPDGVDLARFARLRNLDSATLASLCAGADARQLEIDDRPHLLAADRATHLAESLLAALAQIHAAEPELAAVPEGRLATLLASTLAAPLSRPLLRAMAGELARAGQISTAGGALRLAGHAPRASAADEALWGRAAPHFTACQPRPPVMGELARALELGVPDLTPGLQRLARLGWLVELGGNRFVLPEALRSLATLTEEIARTAGDDTVDIALFRDRSGIGRNHAVRVLEHFDAAGLTRRTRDGRQLLRPADTVFGPPPPSPEPGPC